MIPECQHIYETGRKCRRIPKRGETLCPGHRPSSTRSHHDDPDFARRLLAYAQQLRDLSLEVLLRTVQDDLTVIQPIVERKSSRATYTPFARAFVAVTVAVEQMDAQLQALRSAALDLSRQSLIVHRPMPNSAVSYARHQSSRICR